MFRGGKKIVHKVSILKRAEQEVCEVSVLGGAENVYEVSMAGHEQLIRVYTTVNSCKMSAA